MTQRDEVLDREANCISLICTGRTTMQDDYPTVAEREIPMDTTEQTCIFEVGQQIRVGRTAPELLSTFAKIMKRLNRLGNGKVDDGYLESRHNVRHNFRAKGIGL